MAGEKVVATNRQAYHHYDLIETVECGVVLTGTEVKSIREGRVNFKDSYAIIRNGEAWLTGLHISPYSHGGRLNHDPTRMRKLLLHKFEIMRLGGKVQQKGLTLVPTKCYFKEGRVKFEVALAKGKKLYDKRATEMRKTVERETQVMLKERRRS